MLSLYIYQYTYAVFMGSGEAPRAARWSNGAGEGIVAERWVAEALRRWRASPEDRALGAEVCLRLSRIAGAEAAAPLATSEAWRGADERSQLAAVGAILTRLGPAWELLAWRTARCGDSALPLATLRLRPLGIEMQLIPGGAVLMGEDPPEEDRALELLGLYTLWEHYRPETEAPRHSRVVPPLLIGRKPLLQREWDLIGGPSQRTSYLPGAPIEGVAWRSASRWLRLAGHGLRLPSEAEWEHACRAGTTTRFFWGEAFDERYCWHRGNADFRLHDCDEHAERANAFGLIDTLGHVGEWCADDWFDSHADAPQDASPRRRPSAAPGPKVERGGSWQSDAGECRSACRDFLRRRYHRPGAGLRVARDLP